MLQAGLLWSYDGSEQLHCAFCKFVGQLSGTPTGVEAVVQLINTTVTCKRLTGWDIYVAVLNQTKEVTLMFSTLFTKCWFDSRPLPQSWGPSVQASFCTAEELQELEMDPEQTAVISQDCSINHTGLWPTIDATNR